MLRWLMLGGRWSPGTRALGLCVVLLAYLALYAPTIGYGFVWDDVGTVAGNDFFARPLGEALRATEHARMDEAITSMRGVSVGHESYRPINVLTHWLDVRAFGPRPGPMHAHTLLWGLAGIAFAFLLARQLFDGDDDWALAVAAIFALHPAHVEPFAYISARADLVSGALTLVAAWLATRAALDVPALSRVRGIVELVGAALALLLALFAKEPAAMLPLALFAYAFALGRLRAFAVPLLVLAATVALAFPLRALLVPGAPLSEAVSAATLFARTPGIVLQYLGMLALPLTISNARPLLPGWALPGWLVLVAIAAALVAGFLWSRRGVTTPARRALGLAGAGLAWAALFLAPAGVAVATLGALADRYAYLPVFGFALALTAGLRTLAQSEALPLVRRVVLACAALWALLLPFVSWREQAFWQSNRALYTHAVTVEPDSASAHYRLGVILGGERRWSEAAAAFTRADELKRQQPPDVAPAHDRVLNNLGVALLNLGQYDAAERIFRRAISESNNVSFRAWFNLAKLLAARNDTAGACAALREALAISPRYQLARAEHDRLCSPGH
jgi:protein O-mannosyl-transferase